jgi:hypothetical protein
LSEHHIKVDYASHDAAYKRNRYIGTPEDIIDEIKVLGFDILYQEILSDEFQDTLCLIAKKR